VSEPADHSQYAQLAGRFKHDFQKHFPFNPLGAGFWRVGWDGFRDNFGRNDSCGGLRSGARLYGRRSRNVSVSKACLMHCRLTGGASIARGHAASKASAGNYSANAVRTVSTGGTTVVRPDGQPYPGTRLARQRGGRGVEHSETGWNAASNPPRWRSLLDRALLGRDEADRVDYAAPHIGEQRRGSTRASSRIEFQPAGQSPAEQLVAALRQDFGGPRVIAFANPKGGVHKTTATVLCAAGAVLTTVVFHPWEAFWPEPSDNWEVRSFQDDFRFLAWWWVVGSVGAVTACMDAYRRRAGHRIAYGR